MEAEKKTGTMEDLKKDMEECGFYPDNPQPPLEAVMADARMKIDNALQSILAESKLPLFLFDYLITSVQCDIRKADLDTIRIANMSQSTQS